MQSNPNQTPLVDMPDLATALDMEKIFIKREDQNPSGSHKDRAIWLMIDHYLEQGIKQFVISSSGNAVISAAYYCTLNKDLSLDIYISPNIATEKRERLDNLTKDQEQINIHESPQAKSEAFKLAKESKSQLLRTSLDDSGLPGYEKLATELTEQLNENNENINDFQIFLPTSSGTTLVGLYNGFLQAKKNPALHIVQTTKVNVMAKKFDADFTPAESSLASAIVDTIGHRKDEVIKYLKDSNGGGWVVADKELKSARSMLESTYSWDSLLALAGLVKANKSNKINKAILLFCGK